MLEVLLSLDTTLLQWMLAWAQPPWLTELFITLSTPGVNPAIWIMGALLVGICRPALRMGSWQVVLAVLVTVLVVDSVIKPLVGRDRPAQRNPSIQATVITPDSPSFPSGHAAAAAAGASALSRLLPRARIALWFVAILVGWSRLALGVHYPLDVIGGLLVGLCCSAFVLGGTVWYSRDPSKRIPTGPR